MAKDPAFLFYPGDAAEDVSHMNRLERGCYFDFVQAQKKFGPLPILTIKKILGKDFETCWESLKMCLTYEKDMYYIAWLKDSIEKRQKYSASRAQNRKGQKEANSPENAKTYVRHMEIGNGIINENTIKGVQGEKLPDDFFDCFDDRTLADIRSIFPEHDIPNELLIFKLKCRAAPDDYRHRDSGGIRQAFIYQLKKSNGKRDTNQRTPTTTIIEQGKSFGIEKGFSRSGANGGGNGGSLKTGT